MKPMLIGAAALLFACPVAVSAQDEGANSLDLGTVSRCAAVHNVMSVRAEEGSPAGVLATRRFLQFYFLTVLLSEADAHDELTLDEAKTVFNGDRAKAEKEVEAALAGGATGPLFVKDVAACDAVRASNAALFAMLDERIDSELAK
ncbi:MAG: hypothetical protein Q7T68_10560 [Sphingopyxis sp.]|nr:hypothetical protein [Sphingopyxis sp.]